VSKKINVSRESLCDLYTSKRLSFVDVGKILSCNSTVIGTYLRKFGIPVRTRNETRKGRVPWNKQDVVGKDELYGLYITKGLSALKIGEVLGCHKRIIYNRLREFGIPTRSPRESHKFNIKKEQLESLYISKKLGPVEIGRRLNYGTATIQNRLKEFGISVRPRKVNIRRVELEDLYTVKKISSVELGRVYSCAPETICNRLKEFEIPVRPCKVDIKRRELKDLYIVKKTSSAKLGRVYGCTPATILNRLREFGIPIKNSLSRRIPSSLEEKFQEIVTKHNLPYKYVGDGSFILGNYNPDFINTNSEKIAIEVYARYFKLRCHESIEKWKKQRSQAFKKYNWKIIYLDETEVTEENVLKTLRPKEAKGV